MSSPSTKDRELCWQFRDSYLSCLNSSIKADDLYNNLKNSSGNCNVDIIPRELRSEGCESLRKEMYSKCPESWVL